MNKEINRGNDGSPKMERVLAARRGLKDPAVRIERAAQRIETQYIAEIIMRESAELRRNAEQPPTQE